MALIDMFPFLIASLSAVAVVFLFVGVRAARTAPPLDTRLKDYLSTDSTSNFSVRDLELSEPFFNRAILPILRRMLSLLAWMWPKNRVDALQRRLLMAGRPGGISVTDFIGIKGWTMLLIGGSVGILGYLTDYPRTLQSGMLWLLLCVCGFFLPDFWLSRRVTRRQREVTVALPDTLDMLVVAIEAGLSFENAILEITNKWQNALSREMLQVQRDIGIGRPRRQALQEMSERTGVPDVAQFVSAINQAEDLGTSIGRVLTVQAEEMRIKRRQRAQEAANKAPIKMLFPMVFLIFPALFAVLLGPGVPELLRAMKGL